MKTNIKKISLALMLTVSMLCSACQKGQATKIINVTTQSKDNISYKVMIDTSNDRAEAKVLGAETIQRGNKNYLRVYLQKTNLSDQLISAASTFITYQDEKQLYKVGRGRDYVKEYAKEENAESKDGLLAAYDFIVTDGRYLMPGVTKQYIVDIELKSDKPVELTLSSGELSDPIQLDLNKLPGAPKKMQRLQKVSDPEKWKDAVVEYKDSGTVTIKKVGELDIKIEGAKLVGDPKSLSPTGKLIQLTLSVTNHSEKEIKSERLIQDKNLALVIQDGVNMRNLYDSYSDGSTVIAPEETKEVKINYQPLSNSSVFVVINESEYSNYPASKTVAVNYGMVYKLN